VGDQSGADWGAGRYLQAAGDFGDDTATIIGAALIFADVAPTAGRALGKLGAAKGAEEEVLRGCKGGAAGSGAAKPDIAGLSKKIIDQSAQRGWTPEMIMEAFENGEQFPRLDMHETPPAPATRYVHPTTGLSVVINNATGRVIQVGGPGFRF
jgi:colicin-like ribonuclease protein